MLSHWAPPFSVSFLPATQQPSNLLGFLRTVRYSYLLLLPAALSFSPDHQNPVYTDVSPWFFEFFVFSDFCSNPLPSPFSLCSSSFTSTSGILLLTTSGFIVSYEKFSQIVFPDDPAPFGW